MIGLWLGCVGFQPLPPDGGVPLPSGTAHVTERGAGEPLVLVHGFAASSNAWRKSRLDADRRLIQIDTRGFGKSSRTAGDYSRAALARDLVAVFDHLGLERVDLVAHSWGSAIALELVRRHPERVDQLVLVSSWVYPAQVPWFFRAARVPLLGEVLFGAFYTAELDRRVEDSFHAPEQLTWQQVDDVRRDLSRPASKAAALAVARGLDLSRDYADIDTPSLVVWGAQDRVTHPGYGRRLASQLPHARLAVLDQVGHHPMLEAPERFDALVRDFLD